MKKIDWQSLVFLGCVLLLSACAESPVVSRNGYVAVDKSANYLLKDWILTGRLAIAAPSDSWTASIDWHHAGDDERMRLSGPLGQGAVDVHLSRGAVTIDRGGGRVQSSNAPEQFLQQQLGLQVPIRSLRFWAIGVPEPEQGFQKTASGFVQSGWLVDYREMQKVGQHYLPYKLAVTKDQVKLKLVVEQWSLSQGMGTSNAN
jgi:outer membrane lipoprotein LolB